MAIPTKIITEYYPELNIVIRRIREVHYGGVLIVQNAQPMHDDLGEIELIKQYNKELENLHIIHSTD